MVVIQLATHQQDPALPLAVLHSTHKGTNDYHAHAFFELVYVLRGRGIHHIDERPYPLIAGDVYIMRPGESHSYEIDQGMLEIINFIFIPDLFGADWEALCALPGLTPMLAGATGQRHKVTLHPPHDHAAESLCGRIRDELLRRAPGHRLLCRALALEMLLLVNRVALDQAADGQAAGPVANAVAYLHAHPEEDVSMGDLALEAGLSANYLGERFKAELGVTVADYLSRLRVDRARELLAGSEKSVTDIALSVGFDGASYFGKVFRRLTGHTPRAYRVLARGG